MAASVEYRHLFVGVFALVSCIGLNVASHVFPCNATFVPEKTMDNAWLTIYPRHPECSFIFLSQLTECHRCELVTTAVLDQGVTNCTILLDTRWPIRYRISNNCTDLPTSCKENTFHFKEYGTYELFVGKGDTTCNLPIITNDPEDSNIPIYIAFAVFFVASVLWIFLLNCYRKQWLNRILVHSGAESLLTPVVENKSEEISFGNVPRKKDQDITSSVRKRHGQKSTIPRSAYMSEDLGAMQTNTGINSANSSEKKPKKQRLRSLDTFRGISIVIMIFVNYKAGSYWFFVHSKWNGLTLADMVFPWFVFIMGTSLSISMGSLLRKGESHRKIFLKIFKRSCILFILGLVINTNTNSSPPSLETLRIPGVLQRFAGTYLITATVHLIFARKMESDDRSFYAIRDITDYLLEWIINIGFLAAHIGITFGLDVPGCPKGYLGPGGLDDEGKYINCTGGAAAYIDYKFFGKKHIYGSPTCKPIYHNKQPHDPEGLLGTLTSCFICFLGLQAGKIISYHKSARNRIIRFLIWGLVLCLISGILCNFKKDDGWIPINKNLWSASFVLCLGGFAYLVLAFCYLTIDVWNVWNGAPFYYPGMNAIALYMGHEILSRSFPVSWATSNNHGALLLRSLWGTVFWVLVAVYMHHKKTFITI